MSNVFVFLGPTLSHREAHAILPARYLPPVSQGDVYDICLKWSPTALVLIDGAFDSVPSTRHKEILWALSRRVRVFGCSSMGALRASELDRFGMVGHGLIYRWYRANALADDDEVTVAMGPAELGSPAVSDALFDIRVTLKRARLEGVISTGRTNELVTAARGLYFKERCYSKLFEVAPDASDSTLQTWLMQGGKRSVKADDARGLLSKLAKANLRQHSHFPTAELEDTLTIAWSRDIADGYTAARKTTIGDR
ncbi:tfuA protein [Leisingera caerulea]|uniref:TfuA-like protein n=1 Tax=Leisingera caerulea TaxID=506591 RepID=UPI0021A72CB8|nr:TfuA-like protein [Leisingera caerulea]UWQ49912.1 tfuA protein [Leisingera caerulea]